MIENVLCWIAALAIAFGLIFACFDIPIYLAFVTPERLEEISDLFSPILGISLLAAIVDLGAPLNYHLILGAGIYTFVYILARAFGKYFGAMLGAKMMHMPDTVRKYLGLTLLPLLSMSLLQ